jgi:FAD/FMN-containing dehydrogenase
LSALYFGHVADGNLHVSVRMSGHSVPELEIEQTVYGVVAHHRGSISAEYGIGSLKRPFLPLNPGKIF